MKTLRVFFGLLALSLMAAGPASGADEEHTTSGRDTLATL